MTVDWLTCYLGVKLMNSIPINFVMCTSNFKTCTRLQYTLINQTRIYLLLYSLITYYFKPVFFRFCKPEVEQPITIQNPYPVSRLQPVILFMEPIDHIIIIGQAYHMFSRFLNLRIYEFCS